MHAFFLRPIEMFSTGKYRTEADLAQSPRGEGVRQFLTERGERILNALFEVSKIENATPAQIALAMGHGAAFSDSTDCQRDISGTTSRMTDGG